MTNREKADRQIMALSKAAQENNQDEAFRLAFNLLGDVLAALYDVQEYVRRANNANSVATQLSQQSRA